MNVYGEVGSERAPDINGKEVTYGPVYTRTFSMKEIEPNPSFKELVTLYNYVEVPEGSFKYSKYEEEGCLKACKGYGSRFKATLLEKVRLEDDLSEPKDEFFPTVKKLLQKRQNWGVEFTFHGLSTFADILMEWTERIFDKHGHKLKEVGIYGLVGAAQYPYNYNKDVWKAFCELWSPLTNTLHHGGGEVGITLNDLKQICGLPILGAPYEEYLPPNDHLLDGSKFSLTVVKLLRTHAKLCQYEGTETVSWYKWIQYFYRGKQRINSYGESSSNRKKSSPTSKAKKNAKKPLPFDASMEEEFAAFLGLLLSRFVLPGKSRSIRPETFIMATMMAQGKKISLAPAVLGHIYHGLGEVATYPGNPGSAKPNFGIHFVVGWLGRYFPSFYSCRLNSDLRKGYPPLVKYVGVSGKPINLYEARLTFRGTEHVFYRAVSFGVDIGGKNYIDSDKLSNQCFEHLLCIRSAILPVRLGTNLILEPYYPNRNARQFGFDQGVPTNNLNFCFSRRSKRSLEDISNAYARFFRNNTGTSFHIPSDYHQGTYTYSYCRWWARVSTPYLAQSCHKVKTILLGKNCIERDPVFVITNMESVTSGAKEAIKDSLPDDPCIDSPPLSKSSSQLHTNTSAGSKAYTRKRTTTQLESLSSEGSLSEDINPKRVRLNKHGQFDSPVSDGFQDLPHPDNIVDTHDAAFVGEETLMPCDVTGPSMTSLMIPSKPSSSDIKQESMAMRPLEIVPANLQDLLSQLKCSWIRQSILSGIESIVEAISSFESPHEILVERPQIMRSLDTLQLISTTNEVNLNCFISKVQDLLNDVEVAKKLADAMDTQRVESLVDQFAQQSLMLASKKNQLSHLSQRSLSLKEREEKLLTLKEEVRKMEIRLEADKAKLETESTQLQESLLEDEKKLQHLQDELDQAGKEKVDELDLKKQNVRALINEIVVFASSA